MDSFLYFNLSLPSEIPKWVLPQCPQNSINITAYMASTDNTLLDLHKEVNLYHVTKFSPYFPFTLYYFYKKISSFLLVLTTGTIGDCFYLLTFYSEKFSTWVWRLLFAVNTNLNLSINSPLPFPFSIFSTSPSDSTDATYINFTLPQTGTEHKWTCAHSENITIKRIEYIWAFGVSSCS